MTRWDNLGDWSAALLSTQRLTYDQAARALALRLGRAASLGEGDRVLALGCGFGAELELWLDHFHVSHVVGVEPAKERLAVARRDLKARADITLYEGRAESLPQGVLEHSGEFDALLALDNAYHFDTRRDFFFSAHQLLRPRGRLALTDLTMRVSPLDSPLRRLMWRALGRLFSIPMANLQPPRMLRHQLLDAGFEDIQIVDCTAEVLLGFARHVWQRCFASPGSVSTRLVITALVARLGAQTGAIRYVLVCGTRANQAE